MVRVEACWLPLGFKELVGGQVEDLEKALRFVNLHAALSSPEAEDFLLLEDRAFILEVELDDASEVMVFRKAVESELEALGADWSTAEFDEEDTMHARRRMSRNRMGAWD